MFPAQGQRPFRTQGRPAHSTARPAQQCHIPSTGSATHSPQAQPVHSSARPGTAMPHSQHRVSAPFARKRSQPIAQRGRHINATVPAKGQRPSRTQAQPAHNTARLGSARPPSQHRVSDPFARKGSQPIAQRGSSHLSAQGQRPFHTQAHPAYSTARPGIAMPHSQHRVNDTFARKGSQPKAQRGLVSNCHLLSTGSAPLSLPKAASRQTRTGQSSRSQWNNACRGRQLLGQHPLAQHRRTVQGQGCHACKGSAAPHASTASDHAASGTSQAGSGWLPDDSASSHTVSRSQGRGYHRPSPNHIIAQPHTQGQPACRKTRSAEGCIQRLIAHLQHAIGGLPHRLGQPAPG